MLNCISRQPSGYKQAFFPMWTEDPFSSTLRVIDLNTLSHRDVEDIPDVDHVFHEHPEPLCVGVDSIFMEKVEAKHPFHETKRELLHRSQLWLLDGDMLVGIEVCTLQFGNLKVSCILKLKRHLRHRVGLMKQLYLP